MRVRRSVAALGSVLALASAISAAAQSAPAGTPAAKAAAAAQASAAPPQGYTYDSAGRRDPFVSLVRTGSDPRASAAGVRPEGLPGVPVGEVAIKGIIQSRGTYVAMLQAPDNKTYIVRNGDKLFDAMVKAVTADAVVFVQQVNDPLSLVKQREIRRPLRPTEEGK